MRQCTVWLLTICLFCCCNNRKTAATIEKPEQDTTKQQERKTDIPASHTRVLIDKITFSVKATAQEHAEDGATTIPWVSLSKPEKVIDRLYDADKLVLPYTQVIIEVDYPVNKPFTRLITAKGAGFSRRDLVDIISKIYQDMYAEEEASSSVKTIPLKQRKGLINRNETNGKYGIWGHDLSDLDLSYIEVYKQLDGSICLSLGIES